MTKTLISVVLGLGLTVSAPALADSKEAASCVRTAMWDGWANGWYNHTMRSAELEEGAAKHFLITLFKDHEYAFLGCGDNGVQNLDMMVYDLDGHVVARDYSAQSEATVHFSPTKTSGYYVVLHARETTTRTGSANVALAVTYR